MLSSRNQPGLIDSVVGLLTMRKMEILRRATQGTTRHYARSRGGAHCLTEVMVPYP